MARDCVIINVSCNDFVSYGAEAAAKEEGSLEWRIVSMSITKPLYDALCDLVKRKAKQLLSLSDTLLQGGVNKRSLLEREVRILKQNLTKIQQQICGEIEAGVQDILEGDIAEINDRVDMLMQRLISGHKFLKCPSEENHLDLENVVLLTMERLQKRTLQLFNDGNLDIAMYHQVKRVQAIFRRFIVVTGVDEGAVFSRLHSWVCDVSKEVNFLQGCRIVKYALSAVNSGDQLLLRECLAEMDCYQLLVTHENGMSLLHCACEVGDADIVRMIVDRAKEVDAYNQLINLRDFDKRIPLHVCFQYGFDGLSELLVGSDKNARDVTGLTPQGWSLLRRRFKEEGASVIQLTRKVIERASLSRGTKVFGVILDYIGDDVDGDKWGYPLHRACVVNRLDFVKMLLARGFDPEEISDDGIKPVENTRSFEIVTYLYKLGVEVRKDHFPVGLLDYESFVSCVQDHPELVASISLEFFKKLVLNVRNLEYFLREIRPDLLADPSRELASHSGFVKTNILNFLAQHGVRLFAEALQNVSDIFLCDDSGRDALHLACENTRSFEILCAYLEGGGLDAIDKEKFKDWLVGHISEVPLDFYCFIGRLNNLNRLFKMAISSGICFSRSDITANQFQLESLLNVLMKRDCFEMLELLIGLKPSLLLLNAGGHGYLVHKAIVKGDLRYLDLILRHNKHCLLLEDKGTYGESWGSTLNLAVCLGNIEVMQRLLRYCDLSIEAVRKAFDLAVRCGSLDVALLFLKSGLPMGIGDPVFCDFMRSLAAIGGDFEGVADGVAAGAPEGRREAVKKQILNWRRGCNFLPMDREGRECCISQKGWSRIFGGESTQDRYNMEFRRAINILSQRLDTERFKVDDGYDLTAILEELGMIRSRMAFILGHNNSKKFGVRRACTRRCRGDLITTINSQYTHYRGMFDKKRASFDDLDCWKSFDHFSGQIIGYTAEEHSMENAIILTSIIPMRGELVWSHTELENVEKALKYTNVLFNQLMVMPRPTTEAEATTIIEKIGEIHWWLAHACPFQRGSAAITEMLIRTVFLRFGIKAPAWKENISPDCIALITPDVREFSREYKNLFDVSPGL